MTNPTAEARRRRGTAERRSWASLRREGTRRLRVSAVAGFTLLEVLVAIVVLVMGVAALLPLFVVGTTSHKRGMDQSHAAWIAPRIAAKIQENLTSSNPKDIRGGVWREYGSTYTYDATFTRLSAASQADPIGDAAFLLKVEVKRREAGADRSEAFETVVLRKLLR